MPALSTRSGSVFSSLNRTARWAFLALVGLISALPAPEIKLPITADNSICCDGREQENNQGASPRIKMKGIENLIILNFDATQLKGQTVTKATLHIKGTANNMMVRHVGFSTIATAWKEGSIAGDNKGKDGDSCYKTPEIGTGRLWAGPNSTFLDVYGGRGGTIFAQTYETKKDNELWYEIDVDPRILEACAAGLSYGICMTDDNGQTGRGSGEVVKDGNFSNNYFFAHEQNNSAPYLVVEAAPAAPANGPMGAASPTVKPWPHAADFDTGGVEITWAGPTTADEAKAVLGYRVFCAVGDEELKELPRWNNPAPVLAGEKPRVLLPGLKPGSDVKVKIEVVGRNGRVTATGTAAGKVSAAWPQPKPLAVKDFSNPAGAPPTVAGNTVFVIPDLTKANPLTGNVLEEKGVNYAGDAAGEYRQGNCVWSGKNRTVTLHSLRGEWVAFQIVCENKDAGPVDYKIEPGELKGPADAVIPATAWELATLWYQQIGGGDKNWFADPMIPVKAGEAITVPNKLNAVKDQKNQTVYVELFVPKDAQSGAYQGEVKVSVGEESTALKVVINVGRAVIPNDTHFTWSMNAYSSPGRDYGAWDSKEFIEAEQAFYKLSHLHRADLAVLHYSHSGRHDEGTAPEIVGSGKTAHVKDWSYWDKRFGPILDGSIFKGTPREGSSMSHFYVNLCEHYPTPMTAYKWNDVKWEEHWKVNGPIEEGFPQSYKDAWVAVAKDYIKHAKEKKYLTPLQVYLNDKYFYKQYDEKRKNYGGGVCFWLLDEPQQIDDFLALAFYGDLIRQAQEGDRSVLYHRVDVSRPQWGRTLLDRVVDLNVTGGFSGFEHLLLDWRERYGQIVWTYGGAPGSTGSALGINAQALDLYSRGVDGFVPWLTLGGPGNWTKFEDTCVFYTGKPVGVMGPCASLRLKAYRRGEQDVEYVYLLAAQRGLFKDDPNRVQVKKLVGGAIKGTKQLGQLDAQGAVTESISGLTPDDFERLRMAIAAELK